MTLKQMETFKRTMGIAEGQEWSRVSGLNLPADEFEGGPSRFSVGNSN